MSSSKIDKALDQLFDLASREDHANLSLIRAQLAVALQDLPAGAGATFSIAEVVSDDADDKVRLDEAMMGSSNLFLEVSDALSFLADIEANLGEAPNDLDEPAKDGIIDTADIHALFRDGATLSADQQRQLFTHPALRAEFTRIKNDYALARPSPATSQASRQAFVVSALAAAASDHRITEREFPGGRLRIAKASRRDDMLISFWLDLHGAMPTALLLEGVDGSIAYTSLPRPDMDGKMLIIKDLTNTDHAAFVRLLQDPTSSGTFLK